MMDTIKSEVIDGKTISVYYDDCPLNPREDENLGEILYKENSRYILGDRAVSKEEGEHIENDKNNIFLPVYAYIHSGIALNTTGFSCPWDSGQSGIIYVSKKKIREWFNCKRITKKLLDNVYTILNGEIETFSKYLNGEAYNFITKNEEGEIIDSCCGFYDIDFCLEYAKENLGFLAA